MNRLKHTLCFLVLSSSIILSAQTVTLQFMQTEYDIKGLHMIDSDVGIAVGETHWDQTLKTFRTTILKTIDGGLTWNRQNVSLSGDLWDVHFPDPDGQLAITDFSCILMMVGPAGAKKILVRC